MTKIKNTKKGMAKKTLSISLAVAMLATSNVPVWAAEDLFTDGDVAVEAFTAEEAPAAEEVVEAPVVDTEEAPVAEADARLQNVSVKENGWASKVTVSGKVLASDLTNELTNLKYQWMVKEGAKYRAISAEYELGGYHLTDTSWFIPGKETVGKELVLHIWLQNAGDNNIDAYVSAGRVSKENLNNCNRDNGEFNVELKYDDPAQWEGTSSSYKYGYTGKTIKPELGTNVFAKFDDGHQLNASDFSVEYRHQVGNFVDADSECEVVLTSNYPDLYEGVLTQKYRITPREYQKDDITATVNKEFVYTGNEIVPSKDDIELTEVVRDIKHNSEKVIDEIWTDIQPDGKFNAGTHLAGVSLLDVPNFYQSTLPTKGGSPEKALYANYTVAKRSLTGCTAEINAVAGKDYNTIVSNGKIAESVHIYDAEGKELNLGHNTDYELVLAQVNPDKNGTYPVTIKAKGSNMVANTFIETSLTITTHDFANAHFIDSNKHSVDDTVIKAAVPYTGEKVEKDLTGLSFANWMDGKYQVLEEGKDYKLTFAGVDAGANKGRIIVEGLASGSYTGAKKVYTFDIEAAKLDKVDLKDIVVFDRANTAASDYAPTVKSVKAKNTATPAKAFTLEEGKDYSVKYEFEGRNEIGARIRTTVSITNPNFQGGAKTYVGYTKIAKKQISDCEVKVLGTYTYTGAEIIPDVEVTDANGEVLVKDVDYVVKASNNINVGKEAVVTVYGKEFNEAGEAIYDKNSSKSANFEITPADAANVEVKFADGNTGVTYTGKPVKPTIVAVTLNGNDVTEQFNISYPGTYVNVGKGMVVLTPIDFHGHKNFVGTKEATFAINPRELEGELTVYDENGQEYSLGGDGFLYTIKGNKLTFDYDGAERMLADAKFTATGNYAKYVTENDYEIKYVDNVYGGTAHIYVEGKGNFAGTATIVDAEENIINSVVAGTDYKFAINTYQFKEQHVEIGAAEYAAGQSVKPNVTVTVFGRKLEEGKDYVLEYANRTELTTGKTQRVAVKGIKAFAGSYVEGYFAVVKRDMAHTDITVTERSNKTYDVVVKNTGVVVPTSEYTVSQDGNKITVTAKEDSKYYTGSQTVEAKAIEVVKPDAPVITDAVVVNGNSVKVTLANEDDGATGYDYVIDTDRNSINTHNYYKVNKNVLNKNTTFTYTQSGSYWVYCHSWVRDENGQKVFSDWSNAMPVIVDAVTPAQPKITKVSVSGSTVKVTYTTTENATGYDVVLGSAVKAVAGEKRPVEYGTLVKKNIMGNTVTATFKNVPAGTYYAGLHAFNRTSVDNKKVFSPWSESKKVTVK